MRPVVPNLDTLGRVHLLKSLPRGTIPGRGYLGCLKYAELPLATTTTTATATTTSTTTAATTGPSTATATPAASTLPKRTSFIHDQGPAQKALAVQGGDGLICLFIVGDFHESEAARLSGKTITHHGNGIGFHPSLSEPRLQLLLGCLES
jgi:hypothetical protein